MRRLGWLGVLVALSIGVSSAGAQNSGFIVLFGNVGGAGPVSTVDVPGQMSGQLTLSFHGDPASGCATRGLCGYGGTVVLRPGSSVNLGIGKFGRHGRVSYQAELDLPGGPGDALTESRVRRTGGGNCADATQPRSTLAATIQRGVVSLPLFQPTGSLLRTRCAGPLDADLFGLGPQIKLPVGRLLRGRSTLDLSGSWSFAAGGLAGSVSSTLRLSLGTPVTQRPVTRFPSSVKRQREREVTETLIVTHGQGAVNLAVNGDSATCQFVDSCGIQGTIGAMVVPKGASGGLTVLGPATRPYADFLAALGLSRRGNPRGLEVVGSISWPSGGTITSSLTQGAGCTSQAALGAGTVFLQPRHGRQLFAGYSLPDSMRTRCPGPVLTELTTLAGERVELGRLHGASFTLHLRGRGSLSDDGYTIEQRTSLSLTLRRGRLREQTLLLPG